MPIRSILSGFFRSGTTFVWDYLRRELPGTVCFYEPFHPDLPRLVEGDGRAHPVHGLRLWDEYRQLPATTRAGLWEMHAAARATPEGALDYLDVFHALDRDVLLQPCRAAWILDPAIGRYRARQVHLVRHPLAVERSIARLARGGRRILRPLWRLRALIQYDLLAEARGLRRHAGVAAGPSGFRAALSDAAFFDRVLWHWVGSNAAAIASARRHGGRLLVYEELLDSPRRAREVLERGLERSLGRPPAVRAPKTLGAPVRELETRVKGLGIETAFACVRDAVLDASKVDYLDGQSVTTQSGGRPPLTDQR